MLSPDEVYPLVPAWLLAMDLVDLRTAVAAVAQLVTALLFGQSLWRGPDIFSGKFHAKASQDVAAASPEDTR